MAELSRIRVVWDGWNGGPGVSTFFTTATDYTGTLGGLLTFFNAFKSSIPSTIQITIPNEGDIIDAATGELTGQWQHGAVQTMIGGSSQTYIAGSGALIQWHTAVIHNRRRLQGRTYMVPLAAGDFDSTGWITQPSASTMQNAANQLVSDSGNTLAVWGRPKPGAGGVVGSITTASVPLKPALLRSRRD